jgi:hypothetical protein
MRPLLALALLAVGCHGGSPATGPDGIGGGGGSDVTADLATSVAGGNDGFLPPGGDGDGGVVPPPGGFRHPGILVNRAQLDFIKAKIAAGAEPWLSAFNAAKASKWAATSYTPAPIAVVQCGSFSNPDIGCSAEQSDAIAAYTQALLWYFTGDATYAKNSAAILDAWSATLQDHTLSNAPLQSAWTGSVFPRAAEILRATYPAWPAANAARYGKLLHDVYLPKVINGAANENGNWELSMAEATIAIGVYNDDAATFARGVAMWRARVPAYIYLKSDGAYPVPPPGGNKTTPAALIAYWQNQPTFMEGLSQETCRDFGHLTLGFAAMVNGAETARIQSTDLYAEQSKRITTGFEFNAQYLDGVAAPSTLCGGTLNLTPNPTWEIGYNEYANRDGTALPHTHAVVLKGRPTGATHHIVFETLTHAELGSVGLP